MDHQEEVLIVGAGPIGLACAISAKRRGLDPLVVDQGSIAHSIVRYPVGMVFFTTPERLEIGGHPLVASGAKPTREDALMYYRGVARAEGIRVRPFLRLEGATRAPGGIDCALVNTLSGEPAAIRCQRLVLATGYFDRPNLLGIPGETLPHVSHYPEEPHRLGGLSVVIVGAKNSAIEQALGAFRAGARVTVVHRRAALKPTIKYWLRPDFDNRVKAGEIAARWNTVVESIEPNAVLVRDPLGVERLLADRVLLLTGYQPDFGLLQSLGIELDSESKRPAHDPETLESNVPGVYLAGSLTAGSRISEVFIENGRFDGEKIFGDRASRLDARGRLASTRRPVGE
ncbi:MAG: YpdA family putative bacillithiol disulfide reductase [Gemmatimonadetes bacterium]|nr:YpdA family putative bacillithiol disulfide reductase [Gemmatimonadota bacterium]